MTFGPDTWGPSFWAVIHTVAYYLDYLYTKRPSDARQRWTEFLNGITQGIPCSACESHFRTFQAENPVPAESNGTRDPTFLKWTARAHNAVRVRTNKFTPRVEDVVKAYQSGRMYTHTSNTHTTTLSSSVSSSPLSGTDIQKILIGWQVAFAVVCATMVVLVVVLIRKKRATGTALTSKKHHTPIYTST